MRPIRANKTCDGPSILSWGGVLGTLAVMAFVSTSSAQVAVQTIGGGPRKECGSSAGFLGGTTWTQAQFNAPYATALDSAGNLWVADLNNSDVEEVTQAGNRTSSYTYEYASGSNKHPFPNVVGVAVDGGDNLYVLTTTTLFKFDDVTSSFPDLNLVFEISLSSFSSLPATSITVVNDTATNIYISFSSSSSGSIVRIPQPYSGSFSSVVSSYSFAPAGMAIREDGQLAVSDLLNDGIYVVSTNNSSSPVLLTGGNGPGYVNGASAYAKFNQPRGIACSQDGHTVVCDTGNNYVRLVDASGNVTTLYGTPTNVWSTTCCSCDPALYAGWVDGNSGDLGNDASSRQPASVTISPSGTLFVTELYYNLIRQATGTGLTPVTSINSTSSTTNTPIVITEAATGISSSGGTLNAAVNPNGLATTVFFEYGTNTSYGSNTSPSYITTNLGGTNFINAVITGVPANTVIHYQAVAINNAGTTYGGDVTFIASTVSTVNSNQVGFSIPRNIGIGATAYIPVQIQLQTGVQVRSLQFRVEVTPNGSAPPLTGLTLASITANDYVQFTGPVPGNAPYSFNTIAYTNTASPNGQGLVVFSGSGISGMNITGSAVLGLLEFEIPYAATTNETYTLNVLYPSGTSDGVTNSVAMSPMTAQTLSVSNVAYLAGDTAPGFGYDAGEFGDGVLNNSDYNNVLYASMLVRTPPLDSDAFNAMDVWPQTANVNGDKRLDYRDWNQVLLLSLGLASPNWMRSWTNYGFLVGWPITNVVAGGSAAIPAVVTSPPGLVWDCQANVSAGTVTNCAPGATCLLPVYASVMPGCSLSGFQFRAIVTPVSNGPPVGTVVFTNMPGGFPEPISLAGLSANDILTAWELGSFSNPLQNTSNFIGDISFQIPATALPGQAYVVHFLGVGGAPDDEVTDYSMESFPGYAWVQSAAQQAPSRTSDEWKINFFGSTTSSLAADAVDADGDGALNWQEYLAGTDPTNPQSVLAFGASGISSTGGKGLAVTWLTAPGKTYILESLPSLGSTNWIPVNTNSGNGYTYQFNQTNQSGTAGFYRIRLKP